MDKNNCKQTVDRYSYFITSNISGRPHLIERLHLCSWLFPDGEEYLECGMQIRVMQEELEEAKSGLEILLWLPWIQETSDTEDSFEDLYPALKESENARFIFNEGVREAKFFDNGERKKGVLLSFTDGTILAMLPVEHQFEDGRIKLRVALPECEVTTECEYPLHLYFRFLLKVPETFYSFRQKAISKTICSYDIKINEPRNRPVNNDFDHVSMCLIGGAYIIHIVPGNYNLTFLGKDFKSVRILEKQQYANYVKDMKLLPKRIAKDKPIVVFNKKMVSAMTDGDAGILPLDKIKLSPCSFFSVFEVETIGYAQVVLLYYLR